jgi:hypothetical protein
MLDEAPEEHPKRTAASATLEGAGSFGSVGGQRHRGSRKLLDKRGALANQRVNGKGEAFGRSKILLLRQTASFPGPADMTQIAKDAEASMFVPRLARNERAE